MFIPDDVGLPRLRCGVFKHGPSEGIGSIVRALHVWDARPHDVGNRALSGLPVR